MRQDTKVALRAPRIRMLISAVGNEVIDLAFGANINTAGWLIQDNNVRRGFHHFGKQQFLLIATGEIPRIDRSVNCPPAGVWRLAREGSLTAGRM